MNSYQSKSLLNYDKYGDGDSNRWLELDWKIHLKNQNSHKKSKHKLFKFISMLINNFTPNPLEISSDINSWSIYRMFVEISTNWDWKLIWLTVWKCFSTTWTTTFSATWTTYVNKRTIMQTIQIIVSNDDYCVDSPIESVFYLLLDIKFCGVRYSIK